MLKQSEGDFACVELATGRFYAEVPIYFNKGFGRFSNASGTATLRLQSWPVGQVEVAPGDYRHSILIWEYGTITGELHR